MKKNLLSVLIIVFVSIFVSACSSSKSTPESEVDNALKAIKEQDYKKVDECFSGIPLGDFIYQDIEGFKMYTKNMSWKIGNVKEENGEYKVEVSVINADMENILEKNPPEAGAMMPNPPKSEIDKAPKKTFDIIFNLKKIDNTYKIETSNEFFMEILNVITGGGSDYLLELSEKNEVQ